MKSVLMKMAVLFILLMAPTFIVSGTASAQSVTAIHQTTATQKTQTASPNIQRVDCWFRTDWFRIWADKDQNIDCFANAGEMSVWISNADYVCSGNNVGTVYSYSVATTYPKWTCGYIDNGYYTDLIAIQIY